MPGPTTCRRRAAALLVLVLAVLGAGLAGVPAAQAERSAEPATPRLAPVAPAAPQPDGYALLDADRGTIVAGWNLHRSLPPASTIKLLTAITALVHLPLDARVPVSAHAAATQPMKIGMKEGEVWKLDDALHSLLIVSANDAAYAIAERSGGSLAGFAAQMEDVARRLGLRDSTFKDPAGLDDASSFDGGSRMSPYDLAVVARNALAVPEVADTAKLLTYTFTGPDGAVHHLTNHNKTILSTYSGATGLKTGFTSKAGRTLVASATRNGRTMVAVVMGVYDTAGWARRLLDQGFATAPDAPGTGERVPPVAVVTAEARRRSYAQIPAALGHPRLVTAGAATGAASASASPRAAATTTTAPSTGGSASAPGRGGGGGPSLLASAVSTRNAVLVAVGFVALLVLLRRRAVRRQRARRLARRRALEEARRRRMIDVIEADPTDLVTHVQVIPASRTRRTDQRREQVRR